MKLHQILFGLLILLLPVQLGKHFWPDFSFINGIRVDYLSPTIFLTDLLIIAVLCAWLIDRRKIFRVIDCGKIFKRYRILFLSLCLMFIGVIVAENSTVAAIKLLKIIELLALWFYVKNNDGTRKSLFQLLPVAALWSIALALTQFIGQRSIGGIFWWFGERSFSSNTPGIAQAIIDNQLILRPYATFPHPNVYAGFLLVSSIIFFFTNEINKSIKKMLMFLTFILGILISFSRSSVLSGIIISFIYCLQRFSIKKNNLLLISLVSVGAFSLLLFSGKISSENPITERIDLISKSSKMIKNNLFFGVGLNNYLVRLPDYGSRPGFPSNLQPVHNIYLLILAEVGIFVSTIVGYLFAITFKKTIKANGVEFFLLLAIVIIGFFDHYWLTLQQGQIIFTVVLGICWQTKRPSPPR